MPVAIITDSAASLPVELSESIGIHVVPTTITIDDVDHDDGELSQAEFLEVIDGGARVTTSAPGPGRYEEAINSAQADDGVVVLSIASSMSATYDSALLGAELAGGRVEVVDTKTAAGAQAIVVLEAARAAAAGQDVGGVVAAAERAIEGVRLIGTVNQLGFLVKSGRVPGIAGKAGDALGVNPVFEFKGGKARPLRPSFSREASLDRVIDQWRNSRIPDSRLHLAALHAVAEEEAKQLLDRVSSEVEPGLAFVAEFSSVMVAHVGPGLVGLAWWWEPPLA